MQLFIALIAGLLFGAGLTVSQMVDPNKVLNFLDITGQWDPSLILVMGGALIVFGLGYQFWVKRREKPVFGSTFYVPTNQLIDKPLILGALLFGLGWGLVGICPGPAVANLLSGNIKVIGFVVAMLAGMQFSGTIDRLLK
ncbi:YeeE/YedE family protein [Photobacterium sp. 1_MG-2023]|uniref:YeeE/YedE family protein n=1 Tax=Photobacterium sp. 1_MG-2023 TaxID=3062646 RepID=UPI0026E1E8F2|nr:YeeE/YedE family protein [Photobacterium sp. 1_MG-2023]MDO6707559.1 YeeE/YedE family protein [Photobacterium sp. 1_MG-2023]